MLAAELPIRIPLGVRGGRVHLRFGSLALLVILIGGAIAADEAIDARSSFGPWLAATALALSGIAAFYAVQGWARWKVARRIGQSAQAVEVGLIGARPIPNERLTSPGREAVAGGLALAVMAGLAAVAGGLAWLCREATPALSVGSHVWATFVIGSAVVQAQPALPLDAGRIMRGVIWYLFDSNDWGVRVAFAYTHFVSAAMVAVGFVSFTTGGQLAFWGMLLLLGGWNILQTARRDILRGRWQMRATKVRLRDIISPDAALAPNLSFYDVADRLAARGVDVPMLVHDGRGVPAGFIRLRDAPRPRRRWLEVTVGELARSFDGLPVITSESYADAALDLFDEPEPSRSGISGRTPLLVVRSSGSGRVLAVITKGQLIARLSGRVFRHY